MLNTSLSISMLKFLTKGAGIQQATGSIYVGLLTRLPDDANHMINNASTGFQEVNSSTVTGYARAQIGVNGVSGKGLSGSNFFGDPNWDSTLEAVIIKNTGDDIQMHNISEDYEGDAVTVVGFGLFSAQVGGAMYACGPLVDSEGVPTTATLTAGAVPIFYKDQFMLMMKDDDPVSS